MSTSNKVDQSPELEWIQMKKEFDAIQVSINLLWSNLLLLQHYYFYFLFFQGETGKDKMFRKIKENPMVPIGKSNFEKSFYVNCSNNCINWPKVDQLSFLFNCTYTHLLSVLCLRLFGYRWCSIIRIVQFQTRWT